MFCPNCGKKIPDNAAFCPYCGTSMSQFINHSSSPSENHQSSGFDNNPNYNPTNYSPTKPAEKPTPDLAIFIIILVGAALCIIGSIMTWFNVDYVDWSDWPTEQAIILTSDIAIVSLCCYGIYMHRTISKFRVCIILFSILNIACLTYVENSVSEAVRYFSRYGEYSFSWSAGALLILIGSLICIAGCFAPTQKQN